MKHLKTYEGYVDNPKHTFNILESEIKDILVDISDNGIDIDIDIKSYGYPREIMCSIHLRDSQTGFVASDYESSFNHLRSFMTSRGFQSTFLDQHKSGVRVKLLSLHYFSTGKIQGELISNQNLT